MSAPRQRCRVPCSAFDAFHLRGPGWRDATPAARVGFVGRECHIHDRGGSTRLAACCDDPVNHHRPACEPDRAAARRSPRAADGRARRRADRRQRSGNSVAPSARRADVAADRRRATPCVRLTARARQAAKRQCPHFLRVSPAPTPTRTWALMLAAGKLPATSARAASASHHDPDLAQHRRLRLRHARALRRLCRRTFENVDSPAVQIKKPSPQRVSPLRARVPEHGDDLRVVATVDADACVTSAARRRPPSSARRMDNVPRREPRRSRAQRAAQLDPPGATSEPLSRQVQSPHVCHVP